MTYVEGKEDCEGIEGLYYLVPSLKRIRGQTPGSSSPNWLGSATPSQYPRLKAQWWKAGKGDPVNMLRNRWAQWPQIFIWGTYRSCGKGQEEVGRKMQN